MELRWDEAAGMYSVFLHSDDRDIVPFYMELETYVANAPLQKSWPEFTDDQRYVTCEIGENLDEIIASIDEDSNLKFTFKVNFFIFFFKLLSTFFCWLKII